MRRIRIRELFLLAALIGIVIPFFKSMEHSFTQAHRFVLTEDEALHSELIEHLAVTGKYGRFGGTPFEPGLTTGPAVIVPAAILRATFGIPSGYAGRMVTLSYHFLLLFLLSWLVVKRMTSGAALDPREKKATLTVMTIGLFHLAWRGTSEVHYYNFGVLGEGASLFYLVATFAALEIRASIWAGAFASLAVLSKPYLIFLPLLLLWKGRREKKIWIGVALPWTIWVGWMAVSMGPAATFKYWLNYPSVMRNANGGGLPSQDMMQGKGWFSLLYGNLKNHLEGMGDFFKWRSSLFLFLGWFWMKKKGFRESLPRQVMSAFFLAHLTWWLFLSPGVQLRYLLPVVLLAYLSFLFGAVEWLWAKVLPRFFALQCPRVSLILGALLVLIGVSGNKIRDSWHVDRTEADACGICKQIEIQNFWRSTTPKPRIWTTTAGYSGETGLLLTADRQVSGLSFEKPVEVKPNDWISVGDVPRGETAAFLEKHQCERVFTPGKRLEGFWRCPKLNP